MDAAAAQLIYCGIDPLCRSSLPYRGLSSSSSSSSLKKLRIRRKNGIVRAIATEPKPSESKATGIPKPVNGSSTVGYASSIFENFELCY